MTWAGYVTTLSDPAWIYRDKLRMEGKKRGSDDQYKTTQTLEQMQAMYTPSKLLYMAEPIRGGKGVGAFSLPRIKHHDIASEGFHFMWATATTLLNGSAVALMEHWGYRPAQIIPWIKGRIGKLTPRDGCHDLPDYGLICQPGMGHTYGVVTEFLIVGTRGRYTHLVKQKMRNGLLIAPEEAVLIAPRREYSRKPDEQYDLIEAVCPGPYLELYAKHRREGWTSDGDELTPAPNPGMEW